MVTKDHPSKTFVNCKLHSSYAIDFCVRLSINACNILQIWATSALTPAHGYTVFSVFKADAQKGRTIAVPLTLCKTGGYRCAFMSACVCLLPALFFLQLVLLQTVIQAIRQPSPASLGFHYAEFPKWHLTCANAALKQVVRDNVVQPRWLPIGSPEALPTSDLVSKTGHALTHLRRSPWQQLALVWQFSVGIPDGWFRLFPRYARNASLANSGWHSAREGIRLLPDNSMPDSIFNPWKCVITFPPACSFIRQ